MDTSQAPQDCEFLVQSGFELNISRRKVKETRSGVPRRPRLHRTFVWRRFSIGALKNGMFDKQVKAIVQRSCLILRELREEFAERTPAIEEIKNRDRQRSGPNALARREIFDEELFAGPVADKEWGAAVFQVGSSIPAGARRVLRNCYSAMFHFCESIGSD
jgi:hypothetical protein